MDNIFPFSFPIYLILPLHPSLDLHLLLEYLHTSIGISFLLSLALPPPLASAKLSPAPTRAASRFSSLSLHSFPNLHPSSPLSSSSNFLSSSLVLVGSHHNDNQRRAYWMMLTPSTWQFPSQQQWKKAATTAKSGIQ